MFHPGSHGWTGPCCIGNSFTNAMLRIKVWGPNDLGVPDFLYNWRKINTSDEVTFKEVPHGLGDYPDLIVVQVQGSQSFTSEAQGSASKLNIMDSFIHMGGVVFGYSDKSVRIWYPGRFNTSLKRECHDRSADKLYYTSEGFWAMNEITNDGWGNNNIKGVTSGYFRILAWKRLDNWCTETRISESKEIRVISDFDNSYVTVEVEAVDGSNDGFRFYGIGSVMNDGQIGDYGGLVYAYSDQKLLYWIPKSSILSGQAINIGGIWGRGLYNQTTDDVKIRVRVFNVPTNVRVCRMKEIVLEDFRVNKKSTSSYKRSKISVYDSRTSSVSVGSFGAFIIVTVIAVIIIPDLQNLFKHLKIGYRNLKLKVTDML
ncbi:hypothetical protein KUTeg_019074 [Tegillarca granosa]|uniref:Uncharacterized protein n=1 Tax=Tegillarca granosa TaxID=220873 RepID=A0ABQ9EBG8_TEGGR|nr:hypothetical protein KUTeg_019074 [Tegillarca granosa]